MTTLYAPRPVLTHFRLHGQSAHYVVRAPNGRRIPAAQTLCDSWVGKRLTKALTKTAIVTCPNCMVVKDAWLEWPKRRPLSPRRWRVLIIDKFPNGVPRHIAPLVPLSPEETRAVEVSIAAELERTTQQAQAKNHTALERTVEFRREQVASWETKIKRSQTMLKKAERRLRLAERQLAKSQAPTEDGPAPVLQ